MQVAATVPSAHRPWTGPQPPAPPRPHPWMGPGPASVSQALPFVEPGTYVSAVTRHHPPMPKLPAYQGWQTPVIIVAADQSRSYEYVRTPMWNGPALYPPYPVPVD